VSQPDYDRLLWACDLNFVRGEDSFVRAQWAARPFIWHIYPQDENLHHKKLRAFLERYDQSETASLSLRWNAASCVDAAGTEESWQSLWTRYAQAIPQISQHCERWQQQVRGNGDLATNLLRFAAVLRPSDNKTQV
jgi:uncharacterized repeat protein (TIGR03837 family)